MNQMSTGASNDFERATKLARDMVTKYGMSDAMGIMVYAGNDQDSFSAICRPRPYPKRRSKKVDMEIRRILDEQYGVARKLLEDNRDKVEAMTAALLEWETIDAEQINDIMAGLPHVSPSRRSRRPIRRRVTVVRLAQRLHRRRHLLPSLLTHHNQY